MKTICSLCKDKLYSKEFYCKDCAESKLYDLLQQMRKNPDEEFIDSFKKIVVTYQGSLLKQKVEEAFSFSEAIDKFVIISLKNKYLTGDRLLQNKKDYEAMGKLIVRGFQTHTVRDVEKMFDLVVDLWQVNAEIFCVNDICSEHENDFVVAASARKMIMLIKERNRIKHEISYLLGEVMHETKQFKSTS